MELTRTEKRWANHFAALKWAQELSIQKLNGRVLWRIAELAKKMEQDIGVSTTPHLLGKILRRAGYEKISGIRRTPASNQCNIWVMQKGLTLDYAQVTEMIREQK